MPQLIPVALAALGASSTVVFVAAVVVAVGTAAYGSAKRRKMQRRARDEYNAGLQDRMITRISTDSPLRYVYGWTPVGSDIVAMFSSGDRDQFKHMVCVHAAHECDAIEEVYIAGKALGPLDGNGWVTTGDYVKVTTEFRKENKTGASFSLIDTPLSGSLTVIKNYGGGDSGGTEAVPYTLAGNVVTLSQDYGVVECTYNYSLLTPRVRVSKHLGSSADPADAYLMSVVPDKWTANHVLRGLCYTVITLDLNEPEFQGGPPSVEVLLRGAKLYDFRNGVTTWSNNPALVVYHYLTSEMCGIPAADLPLSKFIAAANACDEWRPDIGARYTINGTVTADQPQAQVLEQMADAMAGNIVATTWDITAGKYVAPIMALSQSDIVGSWSVTPGLAEADIINGVRGQYIGSDTGFVPTDFKPYQNATYLALDGRELWIDKAFPFTDSTQRVHDLCRIEAEQRRNGLTLRAEFSLKAWKLKVDDRVTVTSSLLGWSSKVFLVVDKRFSPTSAVELTLVEDAPSIWDYADDVSADATPNTNLPNPFAIAKLASISCASGTDALLLLQDGTVVSRILATWPAATTQAVATNGLIEVEWIESGASTWQKTQVSGSETGAYLSPVKDSQFYTVRARCVNPYLNIKSDWVYTTHKVIGKTAPPPQVDRFKLIEQPGGIRQFFWDMDSPPADLFAFEVRYSLGTVERPWDQMIPLFAKDRNARQHETTEPLNDGVYTFAIRAVDTTGNLSALRYITEVLDGDAFGPVLLISLPHEEDWPGTKTDCYVVGTSLADTGVLTWNDLDIDWADAEGEWGNTPASPIVYEHPKIDLGSSITVTIRANQLAAGSTLIEISTSADDVTYSAWAEVPTSTVTARYFKVRWTVSGSSPLLYRAQAIFYT